MTAAVSVDLTPPVRVLRIDAGRMNVLTLDVVRELRAALREAEADPATGAVALLGREDAFCAGLDLATLSRGGADAQELLVEMGALLRFTYGSGLRVVAGCTGHAVAAGAMLLLVADLRVGGRGRYKVGFSEVSRGMPLPKLPVLLARDRLDPRRVQRATLLGELCDPETALEMGFLDELVAARDVEPAARERAHTLADLASDAYAGTLPAVRGATLDAIDEVLRAECDRLSALRGEH